MKSGKANILTPSQLDDLLGHIQRTRLTPRHALRDFVMVLLSFRAGLRACEMAGVRWKDVTDPYGRVGKGVYNQVTKETEPFFEVPNGIAKKGAGRFLPMHGQLKLALEHLKEALGPERTKGAHPVIQSTRNGDRMRPHNLAVYMLRLYEDAKFVGCSSHSGRRTLLTTLAQVANHHDCSLIDVQKIAGHANLADTQVYVEASPFVGRMMRSL